MTACSSAPRASPAPACSMGRGRFAAVRPDWGPRSLSGLLSRVRCWPNGDECEALGAANSLAYSQAEQRCRRAVWPQPGGTGRFGDNSVVAGRWQWAGTAARPAPRTAHQSASVAYATVSPTGSYCSLNASFAPKATNAVPTTLDNQIAGRPRTAMRFRTVAVD